MPTHERCQKLMMGCTESIHNKLANHIFYYIFSVPSKAPCTKKGVVEALPDSVVKISARKILCRTHNGAEFLVDYFLLTQSKSFVRQWEKALEKKKKKNGHSKKFVFRLPECINTSLFRDVISWLEAHDGLISVLA